jgi:hypothetical protein
VLIHQTAETMFKVAVGHSDDVDSRDAADELVEQCTAQLGGRSPQAGLLFAAIEHDHGAVLARINDAYPELALIGCTTDGEVSSLAGFAEDSITLMLFDSDTVSITAGIGRGVREDPDGAARHAVDMARAGLDVSTGLCIAVPEGLGTDTAGMLRGLKSALGDQVPICGGMSGDQLRFKETYQFFGREVLSDALPVLLFSGPLKVSYAVDNGWNPIGARHTVTESRGNLVLSIDDKPASDLYTHYFEEHSVHYPLAVFLDGSDDFYLATPAGFDGGTIICQNTVPEGATVQLAEASRDDIIGGAAASVRQALAAFGDTPPAAGLLFSCAGRRASLGTRTNEEYQNLASLVERSLPLSGFYTYGELCPMPGDVTTQSHNCGFVTVLLGEA